MIETLPARWYWDPEIFERERHAVFGKEWQVIGSAPATSLKGDIAGWPVIVVRQRRTRMS